MKILVLAMIVFFLQLSISMVDTLGIYNFNVATQDDWIDEAQSIEKQKYLRSDITGDVSTSFGFGDFIVGLKVFIDFVWRVINVKETMELFGLDPTIAGFVSAPIFILYGLGLAQFIANRGTKSME